MAERRMFAKTIIDSDAFLDMPLSAQALYFHLSMRADDEGFINNPKKIQRMIGASDDDMKILLAKNFILEFESGVIVIKHWKIHNYIRGDRLNKTAYQEERALLTVKGNGAYTLSEDLKEIEQMDSSDIRKMAYKESSLPYSFTYKIKRYFEGKECPVCGRKMLSSYKSTIPTVQHNIPISNGGKHEIDNISVICESCNTSIRNNETGDLNNAEVVEAWDKIVEADKKKIKWFWDVSLLDSQMSDKCQADVGIGKDSIGKDSIDKDKDILSGNPDHKMDSVKEIIDYLNQVLGTRYTYRNKSNNAMIKARLDEGHTFEDFKIVIDKKYAQWHGNNEMETYLRPETLFAPKHFESYLNEIVNGERTYGSENRDATGDDERRLDEHIARVEAGEFDAEDEEFRRLFE